MSLIKYRDYYKPFEFPWAYEYYKQQQQIHWLPQEIPLHEDVSDWKFKLTNPEKIESYANEITVPNAEPNKNNKNIFHYLQPP